MWQVSFELSIFSGRFGSDFYSCIYINDLWTSQSSNRPFSNCTVSSLSIQTQSVINEDYSDGDGVYNGEENTNIERSRHHSRYSSTLWKKNSGSFTTRIIYCNIVFVTSLETLFIEWSVETWEDLENQPELCVMIAVWLNDDFDLEFSHKSCIEKSKRIRARESRRISCT